MTEMEKLAKDFYHQKVGTPLNEMSWEEVSEIIYCAGFRKAREMALEAHQACGAAGGCCDEILAAIGESEVPKESKPPEDQL